MDAKDSVSGEGARVVVKNLEDVAPYAGPGAIEGIRFRAARQALGVSAFGLNVLELDPHCDNHPEHHHRSDGHEEVYVVLRGAAVLRVEGEPDRALLVEKDPLVVRPAMRHRGVHPSEERLVELTRIAGNAAHGAVPLTRRSCPAGT